MQTAVRTRVGAALVVVSTVATVVVAANPATAAGPPVTRVNVSHIGAQADRDTWELAMGETGEHVVFSSAADLGFGRSPLGTEIYLKDLNTGQVDLISADSAGGRAVYHSGSPSVSRDGRFVAFASPAPLAPEDTSSSLDVFVRDRTTATTQLVSLNAFGTSGNADSGSPFISANGRYVAFISAADNLVDFDDNQKSDVFVRDLNTGAIVRVNLSATGDEADSFSLTPQISPNGRYVAFTSAATNLVPDDTNGDYDIFLVQSPFDPVLRRIERVSVDSNEDELNGTSTIPSISANGRYVAFQTQDGLDLVQRSVWNVVLRDRTLGTTTVLSTRIDSTTETAEGDSTYARISPDGGFVAFQSDATDVYYDDVNAATDVFVWSRSSGRVHRASQLRNGTQVNGPSERPVISEDGTRVGFRSAATNFVPGDINGRADMFVTGTGVVGALPPPTVTAGHRCEQGTAALVCTLTYTGGSLGPPSTYWFINGAYRSQYANQMTITPSCAVGYTVRVRLVVTEVLVPTYDNEVMVRCVAIPP
jgi:Tol biopolymer transport system component